MDLDTLLINLEIIAQIPHNGKLITNTQSNYLKIDTRETLQWLFRLIYRESGEKAVNTISAIITESIKLNSTTGSRLSNALRSSVTGLLNLRDTTYSENATERARLTVLINKINDHFDFLANSNPNPNLLS